MQIPRLDELFGAGSAADGSLGFQNENGEPFQGESDRGGQAVRTAAHDDGIVVFCGARTGEVRGGFGIGGRAGFGLGCSRGVGRGGGTRIGRMRRSGRRLRVFGGCSSGRGPGARLGCKSIDRHTGSHTGHRRHIRRTHRPVTHRRGWLRRLIAVWFWAILYTHKPNIVKKLNIAEAINEAGKTMPSVGPERPTFRHNMGIEDCRIVGL